MEGNHPRGGFTLMEVLIFAAIFAVSATFLVSILTSVTRIQVQQTAVNEVNQQISFVGTTIQRLVRSSSLVENPVGVSSTTLVLRMASSSLDKTYIFEDASATGIYLLQGVTAPDLNLTNGNTVPLTTNKVIVSNFSVTNLQDAGGLFVVQANLTLAYNTQSPQGQITKSWQSSIARISAANFDSGIFPTVPSSLDIGASGNQWNNGYFAGNVTISGTGKLGVETSPSPTPGVVVKANGDIGFTASTQGIIFMAPGGNCYRVTLNANLQLATSTAVTCP